MFKNIIILAVLISTNIFSQEEGQKEKHHEEKVVILAGLGPSLELNEGLYGVNGRLYYANNERFCFGPEISFFPFQEVKEDEEVSIIDLNFNAHYIFELNEKIGFYPLSGINYTIEKVRYFEEEEKEEEFGLNYGAGFHYKWKKTFLFAEFKGVLGALSDEFITVGAIISIPL